MSCAPRFPHFDRVRGAHRAVAAVLVAAVVLVGVACHDTTITAPPGTSSEILDGGHGGGNSHFYFLKPMVTPPASFAGTFDAMQSPTVQICQVDTTTNTCTGTDVADFSTTTGSGSEIVRVEPGNQQYIVNWHTDQSTLDVTKTYRIRVLVGAYELGHADVDPVSSGGQLKNVNTGAYVALLDGKTLPITFRIERGAVPTTGAQPIGAGSRHTCALSNTGAAYCWGFNVYGELGTGSPGGVSTTPQAVTGGHIFRAIVTGAASSCGLTSAGAAYCWGSNTEGELGTGSAGPAVATPQVVSGGEVFTSLTAGYFHVCGLTADGTAYCWGYNVDGELGTGAVTSSLPFGIAAPTAVPGLKFTSLSAGGYTTCGVATDTKTYCWGYNWLGELGNGTSFSQGTGAAENPTPQPVSGTTAFTSVRVGFGQSCALDAAGAAYCWGNNAWGALGTGALTLDYPYVLATPQTVTGGHAFASLTVGGNHACGLTASGSAYCWGYNADGELGTGTATTSPPYAIPTPQAVTGLTFSSLAAGDSHTCGILTDGSARCWGSDFLGQLGTGTTLDAASPQPVAGGLTFLTP